MASVPLNHVYFHVADNLADFERFWTIDRSDSRTVGGDVRTYANGRRRLITTKAKDQQIPVTLRLVTDDLLEQLDEWAGTVLLYRDHRGRMLYGTYLTLAVKDYKDRTHYDVGLVFQKITRPFGIGTALAGMSTVIAA